MIRYLRARNGFTCVPIAVINAAKWAGINATGKDLNRLKEMMNTDKDGTYSYEIPKALRSFRHLTASKEINKPSLKLIDDKFKKGYAAILCVVYKHSVDEHHAMLLLPVDKQRYKIVNDGSHITVREISRRDLLKLLKNKDKDGHSSSIIFTKRKRK